MGSYAEWVPFQIVERLQEYEQAIQSGNQFPSLDYEYGIWRRLAASSEMEDVWNFLSGTVGNESLLTNGGLCGKVNRAIRYFFTSPRLSPADYRKEMIEIAKLADSLSKKMKKFCDAELVFNPFTYGSIFSEEQLKISNERFKNPNSEFLGKWNAGKYLDYRLPDFATQIKGIANRAKIEMNGQEHRLRLPRKINDDNLFRTYFIQTVGDYFFANCADYSPVRLATFCSVALEDANITPDLSRRIYELDSESRLMIETQRSYQRQED